MKIQNLTVGGMVSNCFYVMDDAEEAAVVIDPSVPPEFLGDRHNIKAELKAILLTHAHYDHLIALDAWRQFGAPVMVAAEDAIGLRNSHVNVSDLFGQHVIFDEADCLLHDGDAVSFGDATLRVMLTPGHTPGSCCYVGEHAIFSGDTLFANGGYGRFDLPGGSLNALCDSLNRLFAMAGDYAVYPGHGCNTTLARERLVHCK